MRPTSDTEDHSMEEKRYTTVHDRFQVVHDIDGFLEGFATRAEAMAYAQRWDNPETTGYEPGGVTVYDLMAHKGKPNMWRLTIDKKWIR